VGRGLALRGADGLPQPVVSSATFSAVVVMVMVTTLITPSLLKWSLARGARAAAPEAV
jgi:hypothetical protein